MCVIHCDMTFMNKIVMLLILRRVAIIFRKYSSFTIMHYLQLKTALNVRQYKQQLHNLAVVKWKLLLHYIISDFVFA